MFWRLLDTDSAPGIEIVLDHGHHVLMGLIAIVAILGGFGMIVCKQRFMLSANPLTRKLWLAVSCLSFAGGIWAMHFMAIILTHIPIQYHFALLPSVLSIVPIIFGTWLSLYWIGYRTFHNRTVLFMPIFLGIVAMHHIGMSAIRIEHGDFYYQAFPFLRNLVVLTAIAAVVPYFILEKVADTPDRIQFKQRWKGGLSALVIGIFGFFLHVGSIMPIRFYVIDSDYALAPSMPWETIVIIALVCLFIAGAIAAGLFLDGKIHVFNQAMVDHESFNKSVINGMIDGLIVVDDKGTITNFNPAACSIFGCEENQVIGMHVSILAPGVHARAYKLFFRRARNLHDDRDIENLLPKDGFYGQRCNGEIFPIEVKFSRFFRGESVYYCGILKDLSQIKESQKRNAVLTRALEKAADPIAIFNKARQFDYINPKFTEQLGYLPHEVMGKTTQEAGLSLDAEVDSEASWQAMLKGESWTGYVRTWTKSGRLIDEEITSSPILDEDGKLSHYVQIRRDITERLQMERHLGQARKMEAVGKLAAGIAHEINSPSQYIGDNLLFLEDSFQEMETFIRHSNDIINTALDVDSDPRLEIERLFERLDLGYLADEIPLAVTQGKEGIKRISKIVNALKEFSTAGENLQLVDINDLIRTTTTVSVNEWKYVADMEMQLDEEIPLINCYPGEIRQVLLNLVVNAADAIAKVVGSDVEKKGKITVVSRRLAETVQICILDTGTGIRDEDKANIFQSTYSTKDKHLGSGNGLAMVYNVITEKHSGSITVHDNEGGGTSMCIELPLHQGFMTDFEDFTLEELH